jgi:hypothetical protein
MATIADICANVRTRLDTPRPQRPSPSDVLREVLAEVQSMYNRLNATTKPWAIGEKLLAVRAGVGDYEITDAPDFGKPLVVVTHVTPGQVFTERNIDFAEIQNLATDAIYTPDSANWMRAADGSDFTAEKIAFYRIAGVAYARIRPIPQASAQYRIIYAIGDFSSAAALTDSPVLSEHHHLIAVRAAFNLLPQAEWSASAEANREHRKELAITLNAADARYTRDFDDYVASINQSKVNFRPSLSFD